MLRNIYVNMFSLFFSLLLSSSLFFSLLSVNNYAEPRFLFESPYVGLYSKMNQNGTTNFYDAQCGLLLFTAPVSRTFDDFQKDTNEHGW